MISKFLAKGAVNKEQFVGITVFVIKVWITALKYVNVLELHSGSFIIIIMCFLPETE